MMPRENYIIYSFILMTCWFKLNAAGRFHQSPKNLKREMSLSLDSEVNANTPEPNDMDRYLRLKKDLQREIEVDDNSQIDLNEETKKSLGTPRNVNENENINIITGKRRRDKPLHQPSTSSPIEHEQTLDSLSCATARRNHSARYTTSFHVNSTDQFGNKISSKNTLRINSTVHEGEDITLCWIEIITIKEDKSVVPAKRLVIREYMISFENSATIPDEHLECKQIPGELKTQDPDAAKTAFFEVIDENTQSSKVVNFVQINQIGNVIIWEHKIVKCAVGPLVNRTIIEWKKQGTGNPNKRLEIKISPKKRIITEDCSTENSQEEICNSNENDSSNCSSEETNTTLSQPDAEPDNSRKSSEVLSSCEEDSDRPECTSASLPKTSKNESCETDSSCDCENSEDCLEFTKKSQSFPKNDRANDDSNEIDKSVPKKKRKNPLLDEVRSSQSTMDSTDLDDSWENDNESTTIQQSYNSTELPINTTTVSFDNSTTYDNLTTAENLTTPDNVITTVKDFITETTPLPCNESDGNCTNEKSNSTEYDDESLTTEGKYSLHNDSLDMNDNDSTTIDTVDPTMESRRSTSSSQEKTNHKLKLKIRLMIEHVNDEEKEKNNGSLFEVEKHLMLHEIEHGNSDVLKQIQSLNKTSNVEAIKALLNGTSLEKLLDSMETNDTRSNSTEKNVNKLQKNDKIANATSAPKKVEVVKKKSNFFLRPMTKKGKNTKVLKRVKGTTPKPVKEVISNFTRGRKKKRKSRSVAKGLIESQAMALSAPGIQKDFATGLNHLMNKLPIEDRIENIGYSKIHKTLMDEGDYVGIGKRQKRSMENIEEIGRWSNRRVIDVPFDDNKLATLIQMVLYKDLD